MRRAHVPVPVIGRASLLYPRGALFCSRCEHFPILEVPTAYNELLADFRRGEGSVTAS
jgi:hypothetical protein